MPTHTPLPRFLLVSTAPLPKRQLGDDDDYILVNESPRGILQVTEIEEDGQPSILVTPHTWYDKAPNEQDIEAITHDAGTWYINYLKSTLKFAEE